MIGGMAACDKRGTLCCCSRRGPGMPRFLAQMSNLTLSK
ncbi:MAG: hypothetical protein AVDCRST_MAG26-4403 [uncultured Chloroflexia bacterium]|uniref:Uncharacterized protein n=1 Tax=uncultured Chloroflexia bacterium TaxID=1672391 RepID=A0A6J4K3R6_9CHLR|nr:MAG: hypothetical protein AVDCRST_MAG26-4403 [uncultured Chloroflexia bacterium]